jgi:hypothetical protein
MPDERGSRDVQSTRLALLTAFNEVFRTYDGVPQAEVVARLDAAFRAHGLDDVDAAFVDELAEAVVERTPVEFAAD